MRPSRRPAGRGAAGHLRFLEPCGGVLPRSGFPVPDYAFPAPDTYYGVAKVTGEALAALYHHRMAWTRSACGS
jgi:hypothetical protein